MHDIQCPWSKIWTLFIWFSLYVFVDAKAYITGISVIILSFKNIGCLNIETTNTWKITSIVKLWLMAPFRHTNENKIYNLHKSFFFVYYSCCCISNCYDYNLHEDLTMQVCLIRFLGSDHDKSSISNISVIHQSTIWTHVFQLTFRKTNMTPRYMSVSLQSNSKTSLHW